MKYKLLKDLPDVKAGAIFEWNATEEEYIHDLDDVYYCFDQKHMDDTEWFEKIEPEKTIKEEIAAIIKEPPDALELYRCNGYVDVLKKLEKIPYEKADRIMLLFEPAIIVEIEGKKYKEVPDEELHKCTGCFFYTDHGRTCPNGIRFKKCAQDAIIYKEL